MHDEIYEQVGLTPPRGILLVGPSGTGKTAMARALSGEKQIPLIAIDGPQLYSKWLGESEKALREVFKKARRAAPCLLFFDTIDAIAPRLDARSASARDVYQRILSQLLREIDNLRDVKGVILLAATNRPERVDPALLRSGRFDYIVRCAKPDAADRARDRPALLPAGAAGARRRHRRSSPAGPRASPARTSRACARRRRCWRLRNTSAARVTSRSSCSRAISRR